ncbi:uncharacterized protein LOC122458715 [Dermochelys coriacea]|uniref:uncharacterized protein LOC122458715 n=1 Tax=Dermochelys coriacea TaxID=27794 RepID=UPI001CA974AD|nr:uncharacterized protein LOC122458715 [Dermochelys coriacea]
MASCMYVTIHARLRLHLLQAWLSTVYRLRRDSLSTVVTILPGILASLGWWLDPKSVCEGISFRAPQPSVSLVTDASSLGWGAHLGNLRTQGLWSAGELSLHINVWELRAVRLPCQAFRECIQGHCILCEDCNMTAMFYINKQGEPGRPPLCQETARLWEFCIAHSIHLVASFLPEVQNTLADHLSRSFQAHECSVHPDVIRSVFLKWGFPLMDLFASRKNRKCQVFCSLQEHSPGSLLDAFLIQWKDHLCYTFPPFPLVHRVLLKLCRDRARLILVALVYHSSRAVGGHSNSAPPVARPDHSGPQMTL